MFLTKENIEQVKVGGWAYHCCHEDLLQVNPDELEYIRNEVIDEDENELGYRYHENKIDALTEIFATWCRSHKGKGSICDCESTIKKVYSMICEELKLS